MLSWTKRIRWMDLLLCDSFLCEFVLLLFYAAESGVFNQRLFMNGAMETRTSANTNLKIDIEYCGVCDYGGHCLDMAKMIKERTPKAIINCKRGRQGSFEIQVNKKLIYSKLQTMALPDYNEVVEVVHNVSKGEEPHQIQGEQPINCSIQ